MMLGSGACLFGAMLLFRAEDLGGRRFFLTELRGRADAYLRNDIGLFRKTKRLFGSSSLRLLLHYILHQVLSLVLLIIRFVEGKLNRLRLKNKIVAKVIRSKNSESHLSVLLKRKDENSAQEGK